MNLLQRVAQLELAVLSLARTEFGDTEGHAFHGNQYTGGITSAFTDANATLRTGKEGYLERNGLTTIPIDFQKIHRDRQVWEEVGSAMRDAPIKDTSPATVHAYETLRSEVAKQWDYLTKDLGIKVTSFKEDPYPQPGRAGFDAMMKDLSNGEMKVMETHGHPFFTDEEYTRFRAVHDAFGHGAIGRGFDRHSEEAAWVSHAQMFSDEARPAMTTETRGQNTYLALTHEFSPYKMALLPDEYTDPLDPVLASDALAASAAVRSVGWSDPTAHVCAVSGHVNVPTRNHPAYR